MEQPDARERGVLKALLLRERAVVLVCLAAVSALAWWWLLRMGHTPMPTHVAHVPGMIMPMSASAEPAAALATFLMWFIMMVAMMLPSATPMILLYGRFAESARKGGGALLPVGLFASLYLAVWAVFSLLATTAQLLLALRWEIGGWRVRCWSPPGSTSSRPPSALAWKIAGRHSVSCDANGGRVGRAPCGWGSGTAHIVSVAAG